MNIISTTKWSVYSLDEICEIIIGRTPSRSKPCYWGKGHYWLSISDMGNFKYITQTKETITEAGADTCGKRLIQPDTVVFSFKLSIGKVGILRFPMYTNEAIAALPIKNKSILCSDYLYYALSAIDFKGKTDRAVMGQTLNKKKLEKIQIPLPPIDEQHRIATILDKADSIRRKRQEAIRLTEELLRSQFLEMFGDPVTNPKGWKVVNLKSQVAELRYGTNAKCHEIKKDNDLPVLRIPNLINKSISWNNLKYAEINAKEISKLLLKKGDILFVRSNGNPEYIGRCAVFEKDNCDVLYASYLIRARLKFNAGLVSNFIRDIISFPSYRAYLVRAARTTAGNYNISIERLGALNLISPPLNEQEKYMQYSIKIKNLLKKQSYQLKESNNLFNSLLQRAFRGEL